MQERKTDMRRDRQPETDNVRGWRRERLEREIDRDRERVTEAGTVK